MSFTSFEYAGFLALVIAANWALPVRWRPSLLLAASLAFYAATSTSGLVILVAVCLVTWGGGLAIPGLQGRARLALTTACVVAAASSLVVFKAVDAFGLDNAGTGVAAEFVIPVGLSFFCFQAISYLIDIHRDELEPHRSLIDVSLFLAFFPHLLAGPIVRARKLIPSFHATPRRPNLVQWQEATELCLVGVFKKVAVANPIFALCVEPFTNPGDLSPVGAVVALAAVLVAGYFDISGYIDIARGSAKFLGIDMQRNNLLPLLKSTGYGDFWRRWQLTVMMWFRDYVFRPLRGDGQQPAREHVALFGTFFVLGLWHGLSVGWVLWGIASGLIIVAERTLQTRRAAKRRAQTRAARKARSKAMLPKPPNRYVELAIALGLVMATFPLVAARSLDDTLALYGALVRIGGDGPSVDLVWMVVGAIAALFALDLREQRREAKAGHRDPFTLARAVAFGVMVTGVVLYSGPAPQSFVYFNF